MPFLIPETSPQQQLRLRRFFMAAVSYLLFICIIIICQILNIFTLAVPDTILMMCTVVFINIGFYLLFRFNLNLYFNDKSLTMLQMSVATIIIMITIYYIDNVRGAFLLLYVVSFSFGVFRLKVKQFLFLTALIIFSYILIILLLLKFHPDRIILRVEILRLCILAVVFTWFSFLGGYINRLREKVEELATKDELTKVCNRRQLFNILSRETELAKRKFAPFCILMTDIDNFKQINDSLGHLAGDLILKEVATEIKSELRKCDYVGRYGGEEFLIILSYPTLENSVICAERIRKKIEKLELSFDNNKVKATISMGATIYCPEESIDKTLARADKALYLAKNKGKNRVEMASCPEQDKLN
ncbi:MAG: GGDEF domain-containing protein [Nanobdellota archaeon]